ncbi:M23 family peptidase [Sphingobium sp. RSMS]|uniref:M23 family peptidase n=1 Tax=Sphingobium sp. RSMS TaxID=520734 RepID=UPI0010FA577C|nr:M23 family peptidase [Sphingobium sp. RSMS]UXC93133.1 M23 family peptidase [Sphingobium sp. RSMS]
MPRIPTYGAATVSPAQTTSARFRAADNNGGVGGAIARGLEGAGGAVVDFAERQAKIEDDLARTNADNLYLSASTAANSAVNDLKTRLGKDALDYRPSAGKAIDDAFSSTLSRADRLTRRYLEPQLSRLRVSAENEMSSYAVGQSRVYQQETGKAKLTNAIEMAVAADDPAKRSEFIQQVKDQTRANLSMAGLADPEILASEERKAVSGTHTAVTNRYLADKNVELANAYFEAHRDEMTAGDEASLSASLAAPLQKRWASQQVDALMTLPPIGEPGKAAPRGTPVTDGAGAIKALFPQAHVTDNKRDPDSALGKANPRSWHVKSAAAVDVRPIPGMTFDQYVKGVEDAGYTVIEALNEVGSGRSKHATGDHWHIVLGQGGGGVAPSARRWDLQDLTSKVYAAAKTNGWTFEQREAVLEQAKDRVSFDEQLKARDEAAADRSASEWVISKGASFTDISQMPASIRNSLSPDAVRSYMGVAKSNSKPVEVPANGMTATSLELMRIMEPEKFAATPLGKYAGQVTRAEMQGLLVEQAKIIKGDPDKSIRSKVASTISTFGVEDGLTGSKEEDRKKRVAVQKIMETEISAVTGGKRNPTDDELYRAYQSATRDVTFTVNTTFAGIPTGQAQRTKPRFELEARDIPENIRQRIVAGWTKTYGGAPDDEQIATAYRNGKGRFW